MVVISELNLKDNTIATSSKQFILIDTRLSVMHIIATSTMMKKDILDKYVQIRDVYHYSCMPFG